MRLSVCLCTYNGQNHLEKQLESIAAQQRLPDELIVCDDLSNDITLSLLQEFSTRAPFPVRIGQNSRNIGSTANFENAIGLARGDVIVTADQDDVWYPNKLLRFEALLEADSHVGLAFSDADLIGNEGDLLGRRLWQSVKFPPRRVRAVARGDAFSVLLRRPAVTGATMAFRKKYCEMILPIPSEWVHDEWIALLVAAVSRLEPVTESLMGYRVHGSNQVGVHPDTLHERSRQSVQTPRSYYQGVSQKLEMLRARLHRDLPNRPDLVAMVEGKIGHYNVRAQLPRSRLRRAPLILREIMSLRYTRYSGTTLSCIRDMAASL